MLCSLLPTRLVLVLGKWNIASGGSANNCVYVFHFVLTSLPTRQFAQFDACSALIVRLFSIDVRRCPRSDHQLRCLFEFEFHFAVCVKSRVAARCFDIIRAINCVVSVCIWFLFVAQRICFSTKQIPVFFCTEAFFILVSLFVQIVFRRCFGISALERGSILFVFGVRV